MKIIFWFSLFFIFYAYFGYALVLLVIDAYRRNFNFNSLTKSNAYKTTAWSNSPPLVSFIITAFNEEGRIARKIENSLLQTYPSGQLEIIVASDCSSDQTDRITLSYAHRGINLVRAPERKGKENAQMHAVRAAAGDILVFSDVATILKPDAIELIVRNFKDPSIGCVSSEDRFIDRDGNVSGEGLYVKYEMFVRKLESRVNTLIGLSGSFFAARRSVCEHWAPDLQSDFNTLLNAVKLGMRGVSDKLSIGYYENIIDEHKEFRRKVRTVLRGITVMMHSWHLLNPVRYGMFSWQLISHKLCRWMVPYFLIVCLISNIVLLYEGALYIIFFLAQVSFYILASSYYFKAKSIKSNTKDNKNIHKTNLVISKYLNHIFKVQKIAYYFIVVNIAILLAWIKYIKGDRTVLWNPSKR